MAALPHHCGLGATLISKLDVSPVAAQYITAPRQADQVEQPQPPSQLLSGFKYRSEASLTITKKEPIPCRKTGQPCLRIGGSSVPAVFAEQHESGH